MENIEQIHYSELKLWRLDKMFHKSKLKNIFIFKAISVFFFFNMYLINYCIKLVYILKRLKIKNTVIVLLNNIFKIGYKFTVINKLLFGFSNVCMSSNFDIMPQFKY